MRRNLSFLVILALMLAACGGNATTPAPTADTSLSQQNPTAAPTTANSTTAPVATRDYATNQADAALLPPAGTLVISNNPNPDAGMVFDDLTFTRTGGLSGETISITLTGAGVLTRNGVTSQVSSDQITQLVKAIDDMDFFGLDGVFTAPGTSPDAYHYSLTIERNGSARMINAEDGFIPPELAKMFGLVTALGQ